MVTVKSLRKKGKGKTYYYDCACDCGNIKRMSRGNLIKSKSCGCIRTSLHPEQSEDRNCQWKGYKGISGTFWTSIQKSASVRELPFLISIEDAWTQYQKQNGICVLTGEQLKITAPGVKQSERTASLDRIDNAKGYEISNIQWVHKDINRMKGALNEKYFIKLCSIVSNFNSVVGFEPEDYNI